VSRVFGFGFLAAVLLTGSRWQGSLAADLMFLAGLMLAAAGMVGRIWCLVYSSGYKSSQLVTAGPYVVSRNPLYFFSFVGLIGIGLSTATLTLTALVVLFFWSVYPAVIDGEEEFAGQVRAQYAAYCERTPRFFPRWKLFSSPTATKCAPRRSTVVGRCCGSSAARTDPSPDGNARSGLDWPARAVALTEFAQSVSVAITGAWSLGCSRRRGSISMVHAVQRGASAGESRM
jgi:protein-S-isoprenylcysteine O-methyltransferase Ste14